MSSILLKRDVPVSDSLYARFSALASVRGSSVEDEFYFALILGLERHLSDNLRYLERSESILSRSV